MKIALFILFLLTFVNLAFGVGPENPLGKSMYNVAVFFTNNTEMIGYIEVYPNINNEIYEREPAKKALKINTDILPLIKQTYAHIDTLEIDSLLVNCKGTYFLVSSAEQKVLMSQISKIVTLEDSEPEGIGTYFVNYGAVLTDQEYGMIHYSENPIDLMFSDLETSCLINTNPQLSRLDLFIFASFLNGEEEEFNKGYQGPFYNTYSHPFLSGKEIQAALALMPDDNVPKDLKNINYFINLLDKCKTSWLTIAHKLETNQVIKPEEKAQAITEMNELAAKCDTVKAQLTKYRDSKDHQLPNIEIAELNHSLKSCIFPLLFFHTNFEDDLLQMYLLKNEIIWKRLTVSMYLFD